MKHLLLCIFTLTLFASNTYADLAECEERLIGILTKADVHHQEFVARIAGEAAKVENYERETMSQAQNSVQNFLMAMAAEDYDRARDISKTWKREIRTVNRWLKEQNRAIRKAYSLYRNGKRKFMKNVARAKRNCISELL